MHVVVHHKREVLIKGERSFLWFILIIGAVFLDPSIVPGIPTVTIDGKEFSFVRESIMVLIAALALALADKKHLVENELHFEPIREVGFLFVGIFATMMPALHLMSEFAMTQSSQALNPHTFYWATGAFSSVLDNTPSYLNMLAAAVAHKGLSIENQNEVAHFANAFPVHVMAISIGAVFFGAMTYIGNAPNFMVKSIAIQRGIRMPSFMRYLIIYSIPYLLPVLLVTWLLFFVVLN
jgi:Na+/H+ antiporter NhaD/arsenite permease-like protein